MAGPAPMALEHADAGKGLRAVVKCLAQNQTTIAAAATAAQALADSASSAAAAAGKAASGAGSAASSATATAETLGRDVSKLAIAAGELSTAVNALAARQPRVATAVAVPPAPVVVTPVSVDVALTWSSPWPEGSTYVVLPWVETAAALLGKVAVLAKKQTREGCVVTVTTSAVLTSTSATLRALALAS